MLENVHEKLFTIYLWYKGAEPYDSKEKEHSRTATQHIHLVPIYFITHL